MDLLCFVSMQTNRGYLRTCIFTVDAELHMGIDFFQPKEFAANDLSCTIFSGVIPGIIVGYFPRRQLDANCKAGRIQWCKLSK